MGKSLASGVGFLVALGMSVSIGAGLARHYVVAMNVTVIQIMWILFAISMIVLIVCGAAEMEVI